MEEIMVACPECGYTGTHTGVCRWSLMRSGKNFIIVAKEVPPKPERKIRSFAIWTDERIIQEINNYRMKDRNNLTDWDRIVYGELLQEAHLRKLTF